MEEPPPAGGDEDGDGPREEPALPAYVKTGVQGFPLASIPTRFMPKHAKPTAITACATSRARSSLRAGSGDGVACVQRNVTRR